MKKRFRTYIECAMLDIYNILNSKLIKNDQVEVHILESLNVRNT